jgi:hypothetical protein
MQVVSGGVWIMTEDMDWLRSRDDHERAADGTINGACVLYHRRYCPETATAIRALHVNDLNQWRILMWWSYRTA